MAVNPTVEEQRPAVDFARLQLAEAVEQNNLPLPEVFRRVCEVVADALRVERCGVWLFVNGDRALRCVSLFERSKRRHSRGACLSLADSSAYLQAVSASPLLACAFARSDPRTAELGDTYLTPNGITSLLDAPLMRDDNLIGVVRHEHIGPPRDWNDPERALARTVADLLVAKIKLTETALRSQQLPNRLPQTPPPTPHYHHPSSSAHDVRNVLAEILANTNFIARTPDLPPGVKECLAKITEAVDRGVALLQGKSAPARRVEEETGEHETLPPSSDE